VKSVVVWKKGSTSGFGVCGWVGRGARQDEVGTGDGCEYVEWRREEVIRARTDVYDDVDTVIPQIRLYTSVSGWKIVGMKVSRVGSGVNEWR
jgi:hypothetical protein